MSALTTRLFGLARKLYIISAHIRAQASRNKQQVQDCKSLGLSWDARQHHLSPSIEHRCYLWDQQDLVDLSHQETYCLTSRWRTCPWLKVENVWRPPKIPIRQPAWVIGIAAGLVLVLLSALLLKDITNRGEASTGPVPSSTGAARAVEAPAPVPAKATTTTVVPTSAVQQALSGGGGYAASSPSVVLSPGPTADRSMTPPSITTLADGSSEAVLTYAEPGQKTVSVKVPSDWNIASAQLDLSGDAYSIAQVDQKNETSEHDSTWGVRAQQFRPTGNVLTSVDLFLTRNSRTQDKLTVEIREDANGYPAGKVLASVSKPVAAGGYRWEVFDFPDAAVDPGRPYWIVNYVKPLNKVAYPDTPSIGDYGYYVGMSVEDQYAQGDSADFLTFPGGSQWQKYASRKAWDLMFRVNTIRRYFPTAPRLYVDGNPDVLWSYPAELEGSAATSDFASKLQAYLLAHHSPTEEDVLVPLTVQSSSPGVVRVSNVRIVRNSTPLKPMATR